MSRSIVQHAVLALALLTSLSAPARVHAQGTAAAQASAPQATPTGGEVPPEYVQTVEHALAEYEAGNYAEARALFFNAHALHPSARSLRSLGMVEFELHNYATSIGRLEEALASQVRPLEGELRAQTEALLARARSFVARYALVLRPEAVPAQVFVDGEPAELAADRTLTLNVGEHVIAVRAEGFREERRSLSVKGAENKVVAIDLVPVVLEAPRPEPAGPAPAPVLATQPVQERDDGDSLLSSPWLWAGAGAVVVAAVVTAVVIASGGGTETAAAEPGDVGGVVATLRRAP